ncbi:hypothetical protein [Brachybacterium sp. P6-10-X1]|uniref:hypothetical protein n=1 Tax=Brachybacterium sp. P6-10-X1 TaxID=1903186 RepID=UPI0012FB50EE|nr:hypothetical protein [Brachybacterium sp. P6-10-X1]
MEGRRRALRLDRTGWVTAWWLLTSRAAINLAVAAVLVVLVAGLVWTKPWQALIEERVVRPRTCRGHRRRRPGQHGPQR